MASIVAQEKALLAAQAELDIRDHQYHFKDKMEKRSAGAAQPGVQGLASLRGKACVQSG